MLMKKELRRGPTQTGSPISALLTETHVAELLAVSPRTLQAWRWQGGGPLYLKLGGAVRYRPADVESWLSERARSNTVTWEPRPAESGSGE